ncbi:MliC family protein [Sphingomonas sp. DT-207]|uniref:MliC family protein n=1 Tax=Sphingomonas sp. DT-207 TaxID=3396167 RepID=UPI003F1CEE33
MRLTSALAAAGLLAACSQQPAENAAIDNVANTADPAEANVLDETVPGEPSPAPAPLNPPAPGEPGGLDNDTTPIAEGPIAEESAQGAAQVVQSYYALIESGRYRQAWDLWDNGGRASGMTPQAFAASFNRYAEYHANIGAPGRIEAGAGQRYVTVPVQVYGRLKDRNRPFTMSGSVTLHRAGNIDGATPEQRRWRISSTDVEPRPGEPTPRPTEDNRSTANYRCMDGTRLVARFDPDNNRVTVSRGGTALATLRGQPTGSGIHYAGGGYDLRGKGTSMTWTAPNQPPIACTAIVR